MLSSCEDSCRARIAWPNDPCETSISSAITARFAYPESPHSGQPTCRRAPRTWRPENERPFCLFPIGYPADECYVPDIERKPLSEVMVEVSSDPE